jgi:hypothetical protein
LYSGDGASIVGHLGEFGDDGVTLRLGQRLGVAGLGIDQQGVLHHDLRGSGLPCMTNEQLWRGHHQGNNSGQARR